MMENKNLTIIDADSLAYLCSKETLEESIISVEERIANIVENTNADFISLFISKGKYFRHNIFPEYKSKRKGSTPPKFMKSIKGYLEDRYNANWIYLAEADDIVANLLYYKMLSDGAFKYNITVAAIDKDILNLAGRHYNYTFKPTEGAKLAKKKDAEYLMKEEDIIKGYWVETSEEDALSYFWKSMIIGDSSDGIPGLKGRGKAFADKLLLNIDDEASMINIVLEAYIDHYEDVAKGICEFQLTYRLLHMLQSNDDFIREIGEVPVLPNIIDVKDLIDDNEETNENDF